MFDSFFAPLPYVVAGWVAPMTGAQLVILLSVLFEHWRIAAAR